MNNLTIIKEAILPEKIVVNEDKNFLFLYADFFTKHNFNILLDLFKSCNIKKIQIKKFKYLNEIKYKECPSNLFFNSNELEDYFFLDICNNNREFLLETVYLIDVSSNLSILIDKMSETIIISSASEKVSVKIKNILNPYSNFTVNDKLNYLYNNVFFNKKNGYKFIKALISNYFQGEAVMTKIR